ncbi:MAG TPA: hypothetical protein VNT75_04990 [Symbiobacteriaceae bacterium]|nr:hypothetical protein [Symbiobacteriaceae bacterium]
MATWRFRLWGVLVLSLLFMVLPANAFAAGLTGTARTNAIVDSYLKSFGRRPSNEELAYWSSLPSNDSRVQSLQTLIQNHRAWLRSNAAEREATVGRAFQSIYGHGVSSSQQSWQKAALSLAGQGSTYEELRQYLVKSYLETAYTHLLKRTATVSDLSYWQERMLTGGWDFERVWTAIAQSEERLKQFGYWAPARTSYSSKRETCFGAIGSKCEGAPKNTPVWTEKFTRPDGTEMGYVKIQVSVGSILHDNACTRAAGGIGTMCNGMPKGLTIDAIPLVNYLQPASLEWNKAAWNTYDNRFWQEKFGPYPLNEGERTKNWSDDLTYQANRAAKMAPIFTGMPALVGIGSWPVPSIDYKQGETRQTRALKAPKGTAVDRGDQAFCASGAYTEEGNFWVSKWWGICK